MLDHTNNEALLAVLQAVEARIAACDRDGPEIAWEPDPDLLRDLLWERELDREIERQAALSRQTNGGGPQARAGEEPDLQPGPAQEGDAPAFPMLAAALGYAEQRGWKSFPARMEDGKKYSWLSKEHAPGGENWGMTNDPEQLRRNFLNMKWRLKCGVGVPTGWVNRIIDIEADTKEGHGVDGLASLQKLEAEHGKLPDTLMAISPSGSVHRIYKHPGHGIKVISRSLPGYPGVDIKGDGGMFIAPPSVRGDGEYRWLNDHSVAAAPQWLIDLTTAKGNGKSQPKEPPKIEVAEKFKGLDPRQGLGEGIEHPVADIEQIRAAFAVIQNDDRGWDDWNKCGMALFHATGGSDDGLAVFHAWSSKSKKYDEQVTADRWAAYKGCPPDRIGAGSIFHWANEAAPGWERERRAKQIAENIKIGDDVTEPLLPQIMTLEEMRMRLVFVGSIGVVADLITGRVRKKEHAADEYAASQHTYMVGKTLKKGPALKYWIASPARMTVEVLAWVPGAPQICPPPEGPGPAFNMWRGLSPMAYPEDWQERVTPFLEHVAFLVPNEQERERFLQWLTHIVQHPEVLPHTSYLMITPVTGVGRNLLASILVRALRGFVAAGVSLPELLDKGYTGRLSQKLLVIVDEAREGRGERRYERAERFKQLQTEEHRHVNHKYGHQIVEKNCGRWLAFSNHWDAIPFDNTDRRDIVIANPTVRKPDAYYERLYGLLDDKDFIGSVRHWLETKNIDDFRPGEHAPMNPAKLRALNEMMSETERAVAEFKEDCETELTSRDAIRSHVSYTLHKDDLYAKVNDAHLTHAIRGAGVVNTGRRITAYQGQITTNISTGASTGTTNYCSNSPAMEKRFSVVIVRGEWDVEVVKKADAQKLLDAMGLGDWSATKPQR